MNSHFCKVGRVRPSLGEVLGLKELEKKYLNFIEEAYNVMQTDAGLSDILYHEAFKLKKHILNFNLIQNQI
jgi:hypothetical protein